jgi:predicted nucleic acid-binding protein
VSPILVLDASAAIGAVRLSSSAGGVLRLCGEASSIMAPSLFASEVANGLWKYVANGSLQRDDAVDALGEALGLVDLLVPDRDLVEEALVAAARYRHPVYDLLYAVLARRHGAAVLTLDGRLRSLLSQMGVDALPAP